ncbi:class I SAM-dependent DNA methyltransferase [Roseibium aggregatum]|uniref:Class I SAM-dependent methyltransferase n=1 Tax=Roseibium aggregatum TaxID=187304 RepID=A0A926S8G8_9HYPH|nr:class I SAM-dependent methyltransferase [Roseibium aggregatum]MBD1548692.1 class I SAM-dependent methyltransferase [Roseibium aggregatum]
MAQDNKSKSGGLTSLKAGSTDSDAIADYYDDWARTYDETLAAWDYQAPRDAAALLAPHLSPKAHILDVGCGTGLVADALSPYGDFHIDGIDISAESLKLAGARGGYEKLVCHDLQKHPLPLEDNSYDAAISVGVLTYIADAEALFRDLCRCVRPGGVIAFTQRTDRWEALNFAAMIAAIEGEGLWTALHISEPRRYLPENEDFADEIRIIHTLCRVA